MNCVEQVLSNHVSSVFKHKKILNKVGDVMKA